MRGGIKIKYLSNVKYFCLGWFPDTRDEDGIAGEILCRYICTKLRYNCRYQVSQVRSLIHSIYMDIGAGSQITFFSITGQQWQDLGKKWRRARRFLRADSEDDRKLVPQID